MATFAAITTGGSVAFADSTREAVAALNTAADLRLNERELAAIDPRPSVVSSRGFGVMWHSGDGEIRPSPDSGADGSRRQRSLAAGRLTKRGRCGGEWLLTWADARQAP